MDNRQFDEVERKVLHENSISLIFGLLFSGRTLDVYNLIFVSYVRSGLVHAVYYNILSSSL